MTFRLSPKLSLLIIAALFIVPLAVAWMMYNGVIDYRPASTRNLGTLIAPPRPINWQDTDSDSLLRHWVILHAISEDCSHECLEAVTSLRQVHRAAGRNQQRIRVALLLPAPGLPELREQLSGISGSFHYPQDPDGRIRSVLEDISVLKAGLAGSSYLVDPLGNIMMYYEAGSDPNKLKKDLKRLLTWSKLDEQ